MSKFRKGGPTFVDSYGLEEKVKVPLCDRDKSTQPASDLQVLLAEYDDYHNKWIDRVKSIYRDIN